MRINMRGTSLLNVCFKLCILATLGFSSLRGEEFVLTVSSERAKMIEEIVVTMGQTNVILLKFKESHLRGLSRQLRGMGSLNFLGYIFTHPELKENMQYIRNSGFKWNGFMESVRKGFEREKASGKIFGEIAGFANMMGVKESALNAFVQKSDWDGFVSYLIDNVR